MRSRHLTRNGGVPVFQIRVPKALDPALTLSPIRVTLGCVPNSRARRIADVLAGLARVEFARIESVMQEVAPDVGRRRVERCLTAALPTLLGLDALDGTPLSAEVREPATEAVFDALAEISVARARTGGAASSPIRMEVPLVSALRDETIARGMLGRAPITIAPKPDPIMAELAAIREMIGTRAGPKGPLFSDAATRFIEGQVRTYGRPDHPEIGYLEHRKAVFLALVEDKPVDAYTRADLQAFVDELAWLPPNVSKQPGYDVHRTREYIAANKVAEGPGLAEKSIRLTYLSRIKTILREACADATVPIAFEGRIVVPKRAAPSKARIAPDQDEFGKVVAAGVASGILSMPSCRPSASSPDAGSGSSPS